MNKLLYITEINSEIQITPQELSKLNPAMYKWIIYDNKVGFSHKMWHCLNILKSNVIFLITSIKRKVLQLSEKI